MLETTDNSSHAIEEDYLKLSKQSKDILKKLLDMKISEIEGNERFSHAKSKLNDQSKSFVSCNQM